MAIRDRRWAVTSCLERAASSEQGQLLLLRAGLQETEAALSQLQSQGRQQVANLESLPRVASTLL